MMKDIIPILDVFVSGFFGLVVALLTWKLSLQREKSKYRQDLLASDYKKIEEFYTSCIAVIFKEINNVRNHKESDTLNEFGSMAAQAAILTDEEFNNKLQSVIQKLLVWSYNYKKGSPKKFDDNLVIVSTADKPYKDQAKKDYEELTEELHQFIAIIKSHLMDKKSKQMAAD